MSATQPAAARLRALAGRMIARDGWSRAQVLDHQREALRRTVAHAVEHSPYYREVLGPSAVRGDIVLGALPTLSKRTLVEEFDRLVTDPRLRRRQLERHLAGPRAAEAFLGRYEVFSTSGTTGERTLVVLDREDWELWIAVSLRAMARAGVGAGMRIAAIGSPHALHMSRRIYADLRSADAPDLSVLTPAGELRAALEAQRPHGLMGYATLMRQLAEDRLDGRLSIDPRIVVCSSETLTPDVRQRIRDAWGTEPVNAYASTEVAVLATSTPQDRALELTEDLAIVECVDAAGEPVEPGVEGARLLVTSLASRALPLIRYELGDRVTLAAGPGPSGRPWRRLAAVEGRSLDVLRLPGRAGGEVAVHACRLTGPLTRELAVRQYQFVPDGARLRLDVVLRPGADAGVPARLRVALEAELADAGVRAPAVDVVCVGAVARQAGPGAKRALVRREAEVAV